MFRGSGGGAALVRAPSCRKLCVYYLMCLRGLMRSRDSAPVRCDSAHDSAHVCVYYSYSYSYSCVCAGDERFARGDLARDLRVCG